MKRLEDFPLIHRILLAIAIVAAVMLLLFVINAIWGEDAEAQTPQAPLSLYEGVPLDATLLRLDKAALDEAYQKQLVHLFGIWLSGQQAKDATHITNGLKIARLGYNTAATQIAKREQQLSGQQK